MELQMIKMLNSAMERVMNQELSDLQVTFTQSTVIFFLLKNQKHEVYQKDLVVNLGLTNPTVNLILDRMAQNDLVTFKQSEANRRCKVVVLTQKALDLSEELKKRYKRGKRLMFKGVTPEQKKQLYATMQTMLENTWY